MAAMKPSVRRAAIALKGDIEDAASFYVTSDIGRCEAGIVRAYRSAKRAYDTGSAEALRMAKTDWRRAKKCLVGKTGYSHRPRKTRK